MQTFQHTSVYNRKYKEFQLKTLVVRVARPVTKKSHATQLAKTTDMKCVICKGAYKTQGISLRDNCNGHTEIISKIHVESETSFYVRLITEIKGFMKIINMSTGADVIPFSTKSTRKVALTRSLYVIVKDGSH